MPPAPLGWYLKGVFTEQILWNIDGSRLSFIVRKKKLSLHNLINPHCLIRLDIFAKSNFAKNFYFDNNAKNNKNKTKFFSVELHLDLKSWSNQNKV